MKKKRSFVQNLVSFLGCLGPFVSFIMIQNFIAFAIILIALVPLLIGGKLPYAEQLYIDLIKEMNSYLLLVCTIGTTICGYVWYHYGYKEDYDYDVRKVAKKKDYVYIIAMAFCFIFVADLIVSIVGTLFPNALYNYNDLISDSGLGSSILTFMIAVFLAPIGEECFFRGIIERKAEKFLPFLWANILQAALFGIMHMNLMQGVYAFALGLLLGYVHHKYQTLVMPILLHMSFNIFGQTVPVVFARIPTLIGIAMIGASIVVLVYLIKKVSLCSVSPKQEILE